jgi:phospholipase/lecithinase/hemolysin
MVASDGRKYSINVFATDAAGVQTTTVNCLAAPLWNQILAARYGFVYAQCNPTGATMLNAEVLATVDATVDAVALQVADYRSRKGFDDKTLVTVMAGMHDVKKAFEAWVAAGRTQAARDAALAQVKAAGLRLAGLVNQIADKPSNGRVVYSLLADIGYSPYSIAQEQLFAGSQQFLRDLTDAFNDLYRKSVTNDGFTRAEVLGNDELKVRALVDVSSNSLGLTDVTHAACTTVAPQTLLDCTTKTLTDSTVAADGSTTDGNISTRLWADELHPGPNWHGQIGSDAISRAQGSL